MKKIIIAVLITLLNIPAYAAEIACYSTYQGVNCGTGNNVMFGGGCASDATVATWDAYCDALTQGTGVNCLGTLATDAADEPTSCGCETGYRYNTATHDCDLCASGYFDLTGDTPLVCVAEVPVVWFNSTYSQFLGNEFPDGSADWHIVGDHLHAIADNTQLTGTVTIDVDADAREVIGSGTSFNSEVYVGGAIKIGDYVYSVVYVDDDTHLTIDSDAPADITDSEAFVDAEKFHLIENGDGKDVAYFRRDGALMLQSGQVGISSSVTMTGVEPSIGYDVDVIPTADESTANHIGGSINVDTRGITTNSGNHSGLNIDVTDAGTGQVAGLDIDLSLQGDNSKIDGLNVSAYLDQNTFTGGMFLGVFQYNDSGNLNPPAGAFGLLALVNNAANTYINDGLFAAGSITDLIDASAWDGTNLINSPIIDIGKVTYSFDDTGANNNASAFSVNMTASTRINGMFHLTDNTLVPMIEMYRDRQGLGTDEGWFLQGYYTNNAGSLLEAFSLRDTGRLTLANRNASESIGLSVSNSVATNTGTGVAVSAKPDAAGTSVIAITNTSASGAAKDIKGENWSINQDGVFFPKFWTQDDAPDATDIPAGGCAMFVDDDDNDRLYLYCNQGGTMKAAELSQ